MPRKYIKKRPERQYTTDDLSRAVIDVSNKNCTYRQASEIYGIPVAVIYNRIAGRKNSVDKVGQGRSNALSLDVEKEICKCLIERSRIGYPCDKEELKRLVGDYVKNTNLKTPFTDGVPGDEWYYGFMKRNPNLSLKKPEHLQKVRKSARKPEIIYDFYEKLASLLKSNDLEGDDKACFIFNADESAFCSDPSRLRAIGEKGEPLNRVSGGSGRENTTVLACVSADGFTLPPLIIFKGAAVQARWTSDEAYPGTLYGASKNGWMEEPQFFYWLSDGFVPHICKLRQNKNMFNQTALLLYDGHASHISVRIVELAMKNNIHLLRLPSHLTDKLQPLDKAVFGPVKTAWDKILVDHGRKMMGVGTGRLKRDQFSKLLGNVWIKAVISKNIIAGFRSTGVFPVNAEMFPEKEFDQHELAKYRKTLSDQSNIPISENDTLVSQSGTSGSSLQPTTSIHPYAGAGSCTAQETFNSGELVLSTDLEATSSTSINEQTVNSQIQEITMNEIFTLDNKKIMQSNVSENHLQQKKIVPRLKQLQYGEILTSDEVLQRLKETEEKKNHALKIKREKMNKNLTNAKTTKTKQKVNKKLNIKRKTVSRKRKAANNYDCSSEEENEDILNYMSSDNDENWFVEDDDDIELITLNNINEIQVKMYLLVAFKGGKRNSSTYKYVCRTDYVDADQGEVKVTGLKAREQTKTSFVVVDKDVSYVRFNQVLGVVHCIKEENLNNEVIVTFEKRVPVIEI